MKKEDWRKTTKVRIFDGYKRYLFSFLISIMAIVFGFISIIGTLIDWTYYNKLQIFRIIAVALFVFAVICIPLLPKTAREIYAGCQFSVFALECSDGDEQTMATAILIKNGRKWFLITNAHAILNSKQEICGNIECRFWAKNMLSTVPETVEIVKYDKGQDIAVLQFKKSRKSMEPYAVPLKWKSVKCLKGGDKIYVVGNARGKGVGIVQGMVSLPLTFEGESRNECYIQAAVAGEKGNGGALLDKRGRLVGMTAWREEEGRNFVYAIPVDQIIEYIEK